MLSLLHDWSRAALLHRLLSVQSRCRHAHLTQASRRTRAKDWVDGVSSRARLDCPPRVKASFGMERLKLVDFGGWHAAELDCKGDGRLIIHRVMVLSDHLHATSMPDNALELRVENVVLVQLLKVLILGDASDGAHDNARAADEQSRDYQTK